MQKFLIYNYILLGYNLMKNLCNNKKVKTILHLYYLPFSHESIILFTFCNNANARSGDNSGI